MKIVQIVLLFLSMFVMLGGLALPIWWSPAQPLIASIPALLQNVLGDMSALLERVLASFN